ncbi:MAG: T9SS type A sorting domain-containing protein [Saprospiraceae bacterium]
MRYLFIIGLFLVQNLYAQNNCIIGNIRYDTTHCNDAGDFFVLINFEHDNTSASFIVAGNGQVYGTYHYADLPVKIGPLKANCTTNYEFVVKDNEFPNCQNFLNLGTKCCSSNCKMYIDSIFADCKDISLDLVLFASNVKQSEGKYKVKVNGENKGTFDFNGPAHIEDIEIDVLEPIIQIIACMANNENCCDTINYVNPCFCSITEFKTQVIDCNPLDSIFSIKIDFTGTMVGDSFIIGGNNTTYGKFGYHQLPIVIHGLPFSATTDYEFLVLDQNSSFCFGAYELGIVESCDFECHIYQPEVNILPCGDDGTFYARVEFKENNTSHAGFRIRGNGHNYGEYEYGKNYYDVGPLEGDCSTLYEFVIRDIEKESCHTSVQLEKTICCQEDCFIGDISIQEFCEDSKLLAMTLTFNHNQDSTKIFGLWANNVKLGNFHFGSLPLTLTQFPFGFPTVEFTIVHLGNEACRKEIIHVFECSKEGNNCSLQILNMERGECDSTGHFYMFFSLKAENVGSQGFKIYRAGTNYNVNFTYGMDRYKIGPFVGDCVTKYSFILQDIEKPDCKTELGLNAAVCCNEGDCFIREVVITEICDGDILTGYKVNFQHNQPPTQSFKLWVNNIVVGTYTFGQLPITVNDVNFNTRNVVFKIVNLNNELCRTEKAYEFDCLLGNNGNCQLMVSGFERGECNDLGEFYIHFALKAQNQGNQGFKVIAANAIVAQQLNYGLATYKIGPFKGDCVTKYSFILQDIAHPDCKTTFGLDEPVCCNGAGCAITNIDIKEFQCVDGKVNITLDFVHQNTSASFTLKLNGMVRGTYQYQDLPLIIRQLSPMETYKIVIQDVEKDCIEDFNFETPECSTSADEILWDQISAIATGEAIVVNLNELSLLHVKVQMFDVLGRVLDQKSPTTGEVQIVMNTYPSGLYFISVQNGDNKKVFKVYWSR